MKCISSNSHGKFFCIRKLFISALALRKSQKDCKIPRIVLVAGCCPLKTEIVRFIPTGFYLKGEGHPKRLTFLSLPIASRHSPFPLTEISASEVTVTRNKFVSKEATSEAAIWKLSWQPVRLYVPHCKVTRLRSTEILEVRFQPYKDLWLKRSHSPEWYQMSHCRKPFGQNLSDGTTLGKHGLAAK